MSNLGFGAFDLIERYYLRTPFCRMVSHEKKSKFINWLVFLIWYLTLIFWTIGLFKTANLIASNAIFEALGGMDNHVTFVLISCGIIVCVLVIEFSFMRFVVRNQQELLSGSRNWVDFIHGLFRIREVNYLVLGLLGLSIFHNIFFYLYGLVFIVSGVVERYSMNLTIAVLGILTLHVPLVIFLANGKMIFLAYKKRLQRHYPSIERRQRGEP